MEYLFFLGGVFLGSILTQIIVRRKAGYGYFSIENNDPENPEEFDLRIRIQQGQYLLDKRQIILEREKSQR